MAQGLIFEGGARFWKAMEIDGPIMKFDTHNNWIPFIIANNPPDL